MHILLLLPPVLPFIGHLVDNFSVTLAIQEESTEKLACLRLGEALIAIVRKIKDPTSAVTGD
ncbi:hypothetical protein QQP08_004080 [Theobroma cacao]|nr:hypothetical protein QQP08_004080 [Theobroma cacao]